MRGFSFDPIKCVKEAKLSHLKSQFFIYPKVEHFSRDQFVPSGSKEDTLVRLEIVLTLASSFFLRSSFFVWRISNKYALIKNLQMKK